MSLQNDLLSLSQWLPEIGNLGMFLPFRYPYMWVLQNDTFAPVEFAKDNEQARSTFKVLESLPDFAVDYAAKLKELNVTQLFSLIAKHRDHVGKGTTEGSDSMARRLWITPSNGEGRSLRKGAAPGKPTAAANSGHEVYFSRLPRQSWNKLFRTVTWSDHDSRKVKGDSCKHCTGHCNSGHGNHEPTNGVGDCGHCYNDHCKHCTGHSGVGDCGQNHQFSASETPGCRYLHADTGYYSHSYFHERL